MAQFLEERLPVAIDYGGSFSEEHATEVTSTVGGDEYRSLKHPFVKLSYDISYARQIDFVRDKVLDLYSRCNGSLRGFRVKDFKDFTTNKFTLPPTATDQPMLLVAPGVYQLMRWYGDPSDPLCARRRLRKPVAGTVKVGVGGAAYPASQWAIDVTTGLVTMSGNQAFAITGITKGQTTTIAVPGHNLGINQSVAISGVAGMAQINGLRAVITAVNGSNVTVGINSSGFTDYASAGSVQTRPLTGESVTAGAEFDVPCRFDSSIDSAFIASGVLSASGIEILEILNP